MNRSLIAVEPALHLMITQKLFKTTFLAVTTSCLLPSALHGAQQGAFVYTVHGESVTLDRYDQNFNGSNSTKIVVIPASFEGKPVTSIGKEAFISFQQVSSISIPAGVTSIGSAAFSSCPKLQSVNVPQGVTIIEDYTFSKCESLTGLVLPTGLKEIKNKSFQLCSQLKDIVIPPSVETIGDFAFVGCSALAKIKIPSGVEAIGARAFADCQTLEKIDIQPGVKTFGSGAFERSGIRRIVLPSSVTSVGDALFGRCSNLTHVELSDNMTEIGSRMFSNCTSLKQITIPSSVTRIDDGAFRLCTGLATITIPGKVSRIEKGAFSGCSHLESAIFDGEPPVMGKGVFEYAAEDFKIFVENPKGYTIPLWHNYEISLAAPEISVHTEQGNILRDGIAFSVFRPTLLNEPNVTSFIILNAGSRNLTKLSARIKGGNFSDFTVKILSKSQLAQGKSAILEIAFKPKAKGKRVSTLQIFSNDKDETPFEIQLSGIGLQVLK